MLASIHTGLLSGAKHSDSAASPPLSAPRKAKNEKQEGEQNGKKTDPAQREGRKGLLPSALPHFSEVRGLPKKEPLTGTLPAHPVNGSLLWL